MANNPQKFLNRVFKPLLCSRLHFLVSHGLMLITVTGRKTGKSYTTPVAYHQEGSLVTFFSGGHLAWVKNVQGGAPVTLRLRGKEVSGLARPCPEDQDTRQRLLKKMYPGMSAEKTAELLMIQVQVASQKPDGS